MSLMHASPPPPPPPSTARSSLARSGGGGGRAGGGARRHAPSSSASNAASASAAAMAAAAAMNGAAASAAAQSSAPWGGLSSSTSMASLPPYAPFVSAHASSGAGAQQQQHLHPFAPHTYSTASLASLLPHPPPSLHPSQQVSPVAAAAAPLPPFQFLRLKSFSPHTHAVLRRLEQALTLAPNSPEAWMALGEEYRILGARHAFLRLLEHAHARFPLDATIRSTLYTHAGPTRPRTPPPPEPRIQMHRTATYDYKWRHRDNGGSGFFPQNILKLDLSVPPLGRMIRGNYLAFLALLHAEDVLEAGSAGKKGTASDRTSRGGEGGGLGSEVAIVIPPRHGRDKRATPLSFAPQPVAPPPPMQAHSPHIPSSPHAHGKLLSPSRRQAGRAGADDESRRASTGMPQEQENDSEEQQQHQQDDANGAHAQQRPSPLDADSVARAAPSSSPLLSSSSSSSAWKPPSTPSDDTNIPRGTLPPSPFPGRESPPAWVREHEASTIQQRVAELLQQQQQQQQTLQQQGSRNAEVATAPAAVPKPSNT